MTNHPTPAFNARLTGLSCFSCGTKHDHRVLQTVCRVCGMPLRVDYDLHEGDLPLSALPPRVASLWRYREVLPIATGEVTLAEGWTPLVDAGDGVWIKDEARNPTGSFKARGMSAAVSAAVALGARALMAPSAGNAAGAGAADVSTLKEPYRIEGKKTMAYELYEQLGGELPDVIVYPTGGGTGLVGMWKAFDEMEELGW